MCIRDRNIPEHIQGEEQDDKEDLEEAEEEGDDDDGKNGKEEGSLFDVDGTKNGIANNSHKEVNADLFSLTTGGEKD